MPDAPNSTGPSRGARVARIALGVIVLAALLTWLLVRHEPPMRDWASGSTLLGWVLVAAQWACGLGGATLIATGVWPSDGGTEGTDGDGGADVPAGRADGPDGRPRDALE